MKKEFIGFYNPTEKEIDETWSNGTFSFDANTLLNLYRYTELTRRDFLSALKSLKKKLFLPYQAALEYHTNRISVIEGIEFSYSSLYNILLNNFENTIKAQIGQFKRHPAIKIENIITLYEEFLKKLSDELELEKKNHPNFKTDDNVLLELTGLFDSSIGKDFSKEELKKIYEEGKLRYLESVPPGYKDSESKKKKGERHIYGDLIVWKELIEYTKKEKRSLIFVTDDRKEDWWTIENGKTIRPREELIKEFFDLTGIRILIYNADNFLSYAKEKKYVPDLKDNTIKEVKEIRVSDEKSYANQQNLEDYTKSKTLSEWLAEEKPYRHKSIFELLKEDPTTRAKSIKDLLNDDSIKRSKTLREMFDEGLTPRPLTLEDFFLETPPPKSLKDLIISHSSAKEGLPKNDKSNEEGSYSEVNVAKREDVLKSKKKS